MAVVPKLLPVRHLYADDVGKAAAEAYWNAVRLIEAGQFDAAYRILTALVSPGPWRTSRKFIWRPYLLQDLLWLGTRLGRAIPARDPNDDESVRAYAWLEAMRGTQAYAAMGGWGQYGGRLPNPVNWSAQELATIEASVKPDDYGSPLRNLLPLAASELRRRLSLRLVGLSGADDPDNHGAIADTIERSATRAFPRDVWEAVVDHSMPAALLDVVKGNAADAIARLGRLVPKFKLELDRASDRKFWFIEPYADFLASGALGKALGIDDAGTASYLAAFASRSPYTITTPKPKPWKAVLKAWVDRLREDGLDREALLYAVDNGSPAIKALQARAKKSQPLNASASEADVAALEARIGMALPPSYREFLLTTDGLVVPNFLALLPAAHVGWLHEMDADTVAGWNASDDTEATDEQYAVYGSDQDCIHMRPRHLHQALQISTSCDGDVLLLVPAVRFDDEWEAWFLGAKNPGAYRFKSFRALMEQRVLAEES